MYLTETYILHLVSFLTSNQKQNPKIEYLRNVTISLLSQQFQHCWWLIYSIQEKSELSHFLLHFDIFSIYLSNARIMLNQIW